MRLIVLFLTLLAAGCASMTSVVVLDPSKQYPPKKDVTILLKPPAEPYIEIAKLESRGFVGDTEVELLEDARTQAGKLGADAVIVVETTTTYQPPVIIYDPWPPYLPWYQDRWRGYRYWYYPPPFPYFMEPRTLPGGNTYTVRALAIKFK